MYKEMCLPKNAEKAVIKRSLDARLRNIDQSEITVWFFLLYSTTLMRCQQHPS